MTDPHDYANYLREVCRDPQSGSINYGEWGILNQWQRRYLRGVADFIDTQNEEIERLKYERRIH